MGLTFKQPEAADLQKTSGGSPPQIEEATIQSVALTTNSEAAVAAPKRRADWKNDDLLTIDEAAEYLRCGVAPV